MTLKIPKLWTFFQPEREDPKALHDLNLSLDRVYQELYKELEVLDSRVETVNTKVFSGTTDADSQTSFAHGITESKVCGGLSSIYNGTIYVLNDIGSGAYVAADAHRIYINGSNVILDNVGSNLQSQPYRVILFYVD